MLDRTSIDRILYQLFERKGRTLHNFPSSNLIHNVLTQGLDARFGHPVGNRCDSHAGEMNSSRWTSGKVDSGFCRYGTQQRQQRTLGG